MERNHSQNSYGEKVCNAARKFCQYFDETDIQEELLKKLRNISTESIKSEIDTLKKRCSVPWIGFHSETPCLSAAAGGPLESPVNHRLQRIMTETQLPIRGNKAEYKKRLERFYSHGRKDSNEKLRVSQHTSSMTSLPGENFKKEGGKLYISSEYVSDEDMMYIYVTQRGNIQTERDNTLMYLSFQKVDFRGKGDKKARKLKHRKSANDFDFTHTYAVKFKSFDHMNYSGMSIQISLKERESGPFAQKKTLNMAEVSLDDIELDPVSLEQTLFF